MRRLAFLAAFLLNGLAHGAEIRSLDMSKQDGMYNVVAYVHIAAPQEDVFAVLIDYENFRQLSKRFVESRWEQPIVDGRGVAYTRLKGCILFFCAEVERTETIEVEPPNTIRATTLVEDDSDVNLAVAVWELTPESEDETMVRYEIDVEPNFWIPPVIGIPVIRGILRSSGNRAAGRLERLALQRSTPAVAHAGEGK